MREILNLMKERDQLKAEVERTKNLWEIDAEEFQAAYKRLEAEVERLRDLNQDSCERWDAETRELRADNQIHFLKINELQQERDRLRAMCEKLAGALKDMYEVELQEWGKEDFDVEAGDSSALGSAKQALAEYEKLMSESLQPSSLSGNTVFIHEDW